jgi:hypothetical protein
MTYHGWAVQTREIPFLDTAGSFPYTFVHPAGYVLVMPLYTLHLLILASICYRRRTPRFSTLFIAGCIFGMYEAYITKVLWNPPWGGGDSLRIAGVAVIELLVIAWLWHPLMAFILPLLAGGTLSRNKALVTGLPPKLHGLLKNKYSKMLLIGVLWAGLMQGAQMGPFDALVTPIISLVAIMLLATRFYKKVGRRYTMRQLLPDRKQRNKLLVLLLAFYAITAIVLNPGSWPGLIGHITIWILYASLFWLLDRNLKGLRKVKSTNWWKPVVDKRTIIRFYSLYMAVAILVALSGIGYIFLLVSWIIWAVIAIYLMEFSIKDTLRVWRGIPRK